MINKMLVGSVVFGPQLHPRPSLAPDAWVRQAVDATAGISVNNLPIQPCNCRGPQPGQTKCPCALRAEMAQAEVMLREGVVINGRKYRLVPEE